MHRVHAFPFGAGLSGRGADFSLWAPSVERVRLWTPDREHEMARDAEGWHRLSLAGAAAGDLYRFRIGDRLVPDPASRFQPDDVDGPSMLVDPAGYDWADAAWKGRPWEEAVVYELHVGTFTPEGTYAALAQRLEHLRDLGVTAIELMPIADFPGSRSWGYDGVLHYAPDSAYGTPDELKALIDRAHGLGIMVLLDVVYNHFGPQGNYLPGYAEAFFTTRHQTLWGAGLNFDGEHAGIVRDYFIHNALYWLEEYHLDGLRFDAVHAVADDSERHFIAELGERIRAALPGRHLHLILENNANEARWLERDGGAAGAPVLHSAQWNDDIHHAWHRLVTDEADGYYRDYDDPVARLGRCLAEGFAYQGELSAHDGKPRGEPSAHLPPAAFVAFLQNHDQIGNRAFGERIGRIADPARLALARAGLLLGPQIPLLFMGEEWASSSPFQYFVDFTDTELSSAVREGRRREFAGFGGFQDEAMRERIPDPTSEETFLRSRLDWSECAQPFHRDVLAETRQLLAIRREVVVPLLSSGFEGAHWTRSADDLLDVSWTFAAGSLRFLAHFGAEEAEIAVGSGWRPAWTNAVITASPGHIRLLPWTGAMLVKDAAGPGGASERNQGAAVPGDPVARLASPPPRATYRLQFHKGFTFDDAAGIVPYLAKLGISHVYASPIQTARPGSTHGYDIVDHAAINPELGGEGGFLRLSDTLKAHGLGLILDIVPNHMGIGGADNGWWLSVIEWGQLSPHAPAFDIDWERLGANGKLVLPFLGKRYGEALEAGELKLAFDEAEGAFAIWHFEHRFPLNPLSYPVILDRMLMVADPSEAAFREVLAVSARLRALSETAPEAQPAGLVEACEPLKQRLAGAVRSSPALAGALERAIGLINGAAGLPESFDTLHRILEMQSYRLAYWRVAASDINYRRFFDINTLAGIRVEDPAIFERTHALIFDLVRRGRIQGLRIDHIDGLADPDGYVRALQAEIGPGFYVLAEKILGHGESLRPWPIAGTTGYDALNLIDGVLVDRTAADAVVATYREAARQSEDYEVLLHQAKREVLQGSFASELEGVVSDLARIAQADRRTRDYTQHAMRRALVEIIERFPVYRSYVAGEGAPEDRRLVEETVAAAAEASTLPDRTLHRFIARALLGDGAADDAAGLLPEQLARFRRRFQQLTGPVTAKSVEDTLFYRYVPLLALNEVGGEPGIFGVAADAFHAANAERARSWPQAMIATATHDTKRGEDGRARLLALGDRPERWNEHARLWQTLSRELGGGAGAPDANDRHMILQQLLAAWPLSVLDEDRPDELRAFRGRMQGWVEKALREAKRRTSWTHPREAYETAAKALIADALEPGSPFLQRFRPLAQELAARGMVKSLARTVLKLTMPGVPDFYQGTEFWDFSLVDPDNRRPVDYEASRHALADEADAGRLLSSWPDGRIKQRIIRDLLQDRARAPLLYAEGDYRPTRIEGPHADALLAFERSHKAGTRLVLVAKRAGEDGRDSATPLGEHWNATVRIADGRWRDVLTGREIRAEAGVAPASDILALLPVAVLERI